MDTFAVIPSPRGQGFVELSAEDADLVELSRKPTGRVFRKQILEFGPLHYGGQVVNIDDKFIDTMVANFSAGYCDIVQAPKAGPKNEHTEAPESNLGEVIALHKTKKGLYADIDVRIPEDAEKMGKTYLGASAMLHMDYTDTKTDTKVGPTLLHTAITNRPYVTGLEGYEEIIAASAPGGDEYETVVLTTPTQEVLPMTLEEWVAAGKADHNIDVTALQAKAAEGVKLSNAVVSNLTEHGLIQLSAGSEAGPSEVVGMVQAAGAKIVELTSTIDAAREREAVKDAESAVDELVAAGRILPAARDAHVKLKLTVPAEIFDGVVPEKPLVTLSHEEGEITGDPAHETAVEAEIARLSQVAHDKLDAPILVGS